MSLTLVFLVFAVGFITLLVGKLMFQPAKLLVKLGINSLIGILMLWLVNFLGSYVGFSIPLNPFTVIVTGLLGFPGLAMLGILEFLVR